MALASTAALACTVNADESPVNSCMHNLHVYFFASFSVCSSSWWRARPCTRDSVCVSTVHSLLTFIELKYQLFLAYYGNCKQLPDYDEVNYYYVQGECMCLCAQRRLIQSFCSHLTFSRSRCVTVWQWTASESGGKPLAEFANATHQFVAVAVQRDVSINSRPNCDWYTQMSYALASTIGVAGTSNSNGQCREKRKMW